MRIIKSTNYIVDTLNVDPLQVSRIEEIPFLPIQFFKSNKITTTNFEAEITFESSGTTGEKISRHFVKKLSVYRDSFTKAFELFYGNPKSTASLVCCQDISRGKIHLSSLWWIILSKQVCMNIALFISVIMISFIKP